MKFVFQPRSKRGYLRHFLSTNGFRIKREKLVREGGYICSIITAVRDDDYTVGEELLAHDCDSVAWEVPHRINRKNPHVEKERKQPRKQREKATLQICRKTRYCDSLRR